MKILIDSYREVFQNESGGMRIKIENFCRHMQGSCQLKLFDMWNDKLNDYDIVHMFMPSVQNYNTFILAKKLGKKVVISSVVTPESRQKTLLRNLMCRLLAQRSIYYHKTYMFQHADAIIAETIYEKQYICSSFHIPDDRVYIIPNGVTIQDADVPEDYFCTRTGIRGRFVLQVGRFDQNKNQLGTIRALKGTQTSLVLIGGPDKDDMRYYDRCREEADDSVHFLGWVDHDDPLLYAAYRACHTFVLPSHHEILGNALIEAAALGANIVSTNVLPLEDWGIDGLCLSVDPSDPEDMRKKLLQSLETEKTDTLSQLMRQKFSWDSVVAEHLSVYERIMRQKV